MVAHIIAFRCSCSPHLRRAAKISGYDNADDAIAFFVAHEQEEEGPGAVITVERVERVEYQLADWSE